MDGSHCLLWSVLNDLFTSGHCLFVCFMVRNLSVLSDLFICLFNSAHIRYLNLLV